jgi:hypothetical protein
MENKQNSDNSLYFRSQIHIGWKDMDVNEHERLFNITLKT